MILFINYFFIYTDLYKFPYVKFFPEKISPLRTALIIVLISSIFSSNMLILAQSIEISENGIDNVSMSQIAM